MFKGLGSRESPDHLLSGPGVIKAFTQDEQDGVPTLAWVCCSADFSLSGQLLNTIVSSGREISPCYME